MSKHNPGPWILDKADGAFAYIVANDGEIQKQVIAKVWLQSTDFNNANAQLIAAAPDLLEAASYAIETLNHAIRLATYAMHGESLMKFNDAATLLHGAIRKAKGEV